LDLSFEEGVLSIGTRAFEDCTELQTVAFPASLEVIGERAFSTCYSLRHLPLVEGSQLRSNLEEAFANVILPATVKEVDPSAFTLNVWSLVKSPLLLTDIFLFSADSRILLANMFSAATVVIPAVVEVIATDAFSYPWTMIWERMISQSMRK
jgi:hypothetical protein